MEKSNRDAIKFNFELDEFLKVTDEIPNEIWFSICNAINYDAATTVNWACHKLKIVYLRLQNGDKIAVPAIGIILEESNFEEQIKDNFSNIVLNCILEYDLS